MLLTSRRLVGGVDDADRWVAARLRNPAEQGITLLREFHTFLENRNYAGLEMEMVVMEDETHSSVIPGALSKGLRMAFR